MPAILHISRAASIALHAMQFISRQKGTQNVREIAEELDASYHHVAKVMQKMVHAGLCQSAKGPAGGFELKKPAHDIFLMDIYEAVEGPVPKDACPEALGLCPFDDCIWGEFGTETARQFREYLNNKCLSEV